MRSGKREAKRRRGGLAAPLRRLLLAVPVAVVSLGATTDAQETEALGRVVEKAKTPVPPGHSVVGTGFFVSPTRIVTSGHVLAGCASFMVENPTLGAVKARLVGIESARDIALLLVDRESRSWLSATDGKPPRSGTPLAVIGYPFSYGGRGVPVAFEGRMGTLAADAAGVPIVRFNAHLPPGLSGAPLLDADNCVVGVVVGLIKGRDFNAVATAATSLPDYLRPLGAGVPHYRNDTRNSDAWPQDAIVQVKCN